MMRHKRCRCYNCSREDVRYEKIDNVLDKETEVDIYCTLLERDNNQHNEENTQWPDYKN